MRENMKRVSKKPTSGKHVWCFAFLGVLLAGATFVLGLGAGRRMAQTPTAVYETNPLLESDKKTAALAQIQLQHTQRPPPPSKPPLTFQEELLKPSPVAIAKPVAVPIAAEPVAAIVAEPKPLKETPAPLAPSAPTPTPAPAPAATAQGNLKDAFFELAQESTEMAKPVATSREWTLQVSSHKGQEEAERVVAKLNGKGYQAYVVAAELGERGTWHRVRVGQFASKQEAEILADALADEMPMSAPLVISLR